MASVTSPGFDGCMLHPSWGRFSCAVRFGVGVCGCPSSGLEFGFEVGVADGFLVGVDPGWWGAGRPGVMVQWPWWMSRWWCAQSRQPVSRLLGPPAVQGVMWCVSHQEGA